MGEPLPVMANPEEGGEITWAWVWRTYIGMDNMYDAVGSGGPEASEFLVLLDEILCDLAGNKGCTSRPRFDWELRSAA